EEDEIQTRTNLVLEDIINFNQSIFENMDNINSRNENDEYDERNEENRNMEFNPTDIVDQILGNRLNN
ncbi:hypothetical protein C1645_816744, partial [Glomus cerebriforme]